MAQQRLTRRAACALLLASLLWEGCQAWFVAHHQPPLVVPSASVSSKHKRSLLFWLPSISTSKFNGLASGRLLAVPKRKQHDDRDDHRRRHHHHHHHESTYVATCIPGLANILAQELIDLGSHNVETTGNSAVRFTASSRTILQVLIWARTPHKIMELLCESPPDLENRNDLYSFVRDTIPIKQILGDGKGGLLKLSVSTTLNNAAQIPTDINHSHYTALTIKNALVDAVRDLRGDRPDVDITDPDLPLVAVLRGTRGGANAAGGGGAQLSLFRQIHHGSLHRRGYRPLDSAIHKAAMKESLAAGLLLSAEWPQQVKQHLQQQKDKGGADNDESPLVLVDPMAGSGTLLLEAIFMAADVAPHVLRLKCGLEPLEAHRYPPIIRWKHDNDDDEDMESLWKELLLDASERAKAGLRNLQRRSDNNNSQEKPTTIYFLANDVNPRALDLLQESLEHAGVDSLVKVYQSSCREFVPLPPTTTSSSSPWTVVCNPPWGIRLTEDISETWEELRFFLRETCPQGTVAHILSGNPQATKHLGLRRSASLPIQVGQVQMRWITYIMQKPTATNTDNRDKMVESLSAFDKYRKPNDNFTKKDSARFDTFNKSSNNQKNGVLENNAFSTNSKNKSASSDVKKKQVVSRAATEANDDWLID